MSAVDIAVGFYREVKILQAMKEQMKNYKHAPKEPLNQGKARRRNQGLGETKKDI
jgi:hypothetical protein